MDISSMISILIPTAVGGFSALWCIHTFKEGQKLKRKETLFPLIDELDKSETMKDARLILDDRVIRYKRKWKKSIDNFNIIWEEIQEDYRPLKDFLKDEMGLDWIENHKFVNNEDKNAVTISDQDHFLSIIINEKLPYCVDEKTLDKLIRMEDNKSKYRDIYYMYADVADKKVNQLGHYYHKSNLEHILRKHHDSPIMKG